MHEIASKLTYICEPVSPVYIQIGNTVISVERTGMGVTVTAMPLLSPDKEMVIDNLFIQFDRTEDKIFSCLENATQEQFIGWVRSEKGVDFYSQSIETRHAFIKEFIELKKIIFCKPSRGFDLT